MIKLIPIRVECYSSYKADEFPKCFYWNNKRYEIQQIIDRWYQGDINPDWPVSNYYKVDTTGGEQYIIRHDLESDMWHLCK